VGLERGPLNLVRIIEELLERTVAVPVKKTEINGRGDSFRWPRDTLYVLKLALTSPTSGGRSVGIVCWRTKPWSFLALQPFVEPWPLFQFLVLYTVGRTPWTVNHPVARPLPTHITTKTQNKRTQTLVPWVEFEPTIPTFERAKNVHAVAW
jgi:hypothetical protein